MRISDLVSLAWRSLAERKGRTAGAVVGVLIAFVAFSTALSVGETFKQQTISFFEESFGTNKVFLVSNEPLTDADIHLMSAIPYVERVIPILSSNGVIRGATGEQISVTVYGVRPSDVEYLLPSDVVIEGQMAVAGRGVLVGEFVAVDRVTKVRRIYTGQVTGVRIGDKELSVIATGVIAAGHPGLVQTQTAVIMDVDLLRRALGIGGYPLVVVVVDDRRNVGTVIEYLKAFFPGAETFSLTFFIRQIEAFLSSFQLFLGGVSGVAAVVTALWIYDTMTISVIQRVKEIGILKALGYRKRHILLMFLMETLIISFLGAALGSLALLAVTRLPLPFGFMGQPLYPVMYPWVVGLGIALIMGVNVLGALIPAHRASRLNPVEALRYE